MKKLEQVQAQSLRIFTGAKRHSSTAATEVITGFMPVRFRFGDLCCREYVKLLHKEASHPLKQLMNCSVREGAKFILKYKSRDLLRIMSSSELECEGLVPLELVLADRQIEQVEICKGIGNARNRTSQEREFGMNQFCQFVSLQKQSSVIIFTNGSVFDGPISCGACSAVVVTPYSSGTSYEWSQPVGRLVENVECKVEGIVLAMELAIHVVRNEKQQQLGSDVFICCDCTAAIDIVVRRSDPHKRPKLIRRILELEKVLHDYGLGVKILWVPGHAGVEGNEKADRLAKSTAKDVYDGQQRGENKLTISGAIQLSKKLAVKAWQRYWERCEGAIMHTKQLVPYVTTKVLLPADRKTCVGLLYVDY